ncbi:hypothetical protein H1215_11875, partial [Anoxybacillus sp. LAT_38]|nr:hypothetical protein [Anoxybacillus sp. LAT_38]
KPPGTGRRCTVQRFCILRHAGVPTGYRVSTPAFFAFSAPNPFCRPDRKWRNRRELNHHKISKVKGTPDHGKAA